MDTDLKVLIVDDSRIFRSVIEKILNDAKRIKVVGSVRNGEKAIEFIKTNPVDIVTLDQEMPDMDGLETLKAIQQFNSENKPAADIGVIMISAFTVKGAEITMKALEEGAFDFIAKPEGEDMEENIAVLQRQLTVKLHNFATNRLGRKKVAPVSATMPIAKAKVETKTDSEEKKKKIEYAPASANVRAVLIGVSTGGPKALLQMLPGLSEKIDLPIFIVQHMPPTFTQSLAKSLDAKCRHTVIEGLHNDLIKNDHIYVAPGGKHMVLTRDANKQIITALTDEPPENGCRPSVDVLFRSAPAIFRGDLVAIILTGMGNDGTKGLEPLKQAGAHVIAQDEKTSVVWGMPGSVVNAGLADKELPLDDIPEAVYRFTQNKR